MTRDDEGRWVVMNGGEYRRVLESDERWRSLSCFADLAEQINVVMMSAMLRLMIDDGDIDGDITVRVLRVIMMTMVRMKVRIVEEGWWFRRNWQG